MALVQITLEQLRAELTTLVAQAYQRGPIMGGIFETAYRTGLRISEILEVERWSRPEPETWNVQLSKGEGIREINFDSVAYEINDYYDTHTPFTMETYSAVNNLYKRYAPVFMFNGNSRRTCLHAFRYAYMKQLKEEGMSLQDIAAVMGHVSAANTAAYVNDEIRMYER